MPMTDKQWRYAQARAAGMSQTRAAIEAGYSEKTAQPASSRLEKEPVIMKAIAKIKAGEATGPDNTPQEPRAFPPLADDDAELLGIGPVDDPLHFLKLVMNHDRVEIKVRVDAAKSLAGYKYAKPGEKGKKEQAEEDAKTADVGTGWEDLLNHKVTPIRKAAN